MYAPLKSHWATVKRILHYLHGTVDFGLHLTRSTSSVLQCFTHSDWIGKIDDIHSMGGYAFYLGSNLVSWLSRKQRTVDRSSTESENG